MGESEVAELQSIAGGFQSVVQQLKVAASFLSSGLVTGPAPGTPVGGENVAAPLSAAFDALGDHLESLATVVTRLAQGDPQTNEWIQWLKDSHDSLRADHDRLRTEHDSLSAEHDSLREHDDDVARNLATLRFDHEQLTEQVHQPQS